jgi:hypothetical protein
MDLKKRAGRFEFSQSQLSRVSIEVLRIGMEQENGL